jgi:hypothetical protein
MKNGIPDAMFSPGLALLAFSIVTNYNARVPIPASKFPPVRDIDDAFRRIDLAGDVDRC